MTVHYVPKKRRPTYRLNATARDAIRQSGLSIADFVRAWSPFTETWTGDKCGCSDDRCIGFHHDEREECMCLAYSISEAKAMTS